MIESTDTIVRTIINTEDTGDGITDLKNAIMTTTDVMIAVMTVMTDEMIVVTTDVMTAMTDTMIAVMTEVMMVVEIIRVTGIPGKKIKAINR